MPAPKAIYVLFDRTGVWANAYTSRREAEQDAWGPRFDTYKIVRYVKETKNACPTR